jgi:hypothetical protein
MNNRAATYFLSLFFVFLLFARDIVMVFPSVFISESAVSALHIDWADEESERNRSSEESARYNINEFTAGYHSYNLDLPVLFLSTGESRLANSSFKQTFYGSVLTPPPDRA